jgi:release factor glutamine methyltransferase
LKINLGFENSFTVISLLNQTTVLLTLPHLETPRLDAEVLLAHVLKTTKTSLYLSLHKYVTAPKRALLRELIARRIKGEPVAYLVGRKEFWSLPFEVSPAVMIPRPQTETLIEEALKVFSAESSPAVLEIGTGSGAITVALATELPRASIIATDISPAALSIAEKNAAANGVNDSIIFVEGDLFAAVEFHRRNFDLVISNPPYIPSETIPRLPAGIRDYEPRIALDGGFDGLDFYRTLAEQAPDYLRPGGCLLLEVGSGQSQEVCTMIARSGAFSTPETLRDLSDIERGIKAFRR